MGNPSRIAFTLFGRDIYWYGVLMALGIILAVFLAAKEEKRKGLPKDTIVDICLIIIPCGIVGARLYYVLFELEHYLANPISMLYVWEGGLAIYGAVIGGFIGLLVYAKKKKIRFLRLADIIVPGLALAQAIGRWGNYFNQEAFGPAITNAQMQWFPLAVNIEGTHYFNGQLCTQPYHLATFFIESLWCLLIFLFLWNMRKEFRHDGDAFLWYGLLYGFERMLVEGLRGDSLWLIKDVIRVSQLISLLLFLAVLVFMIVRSRKEKQVGHLIWPVMPAPEDAAAIPAEQETAAADEVDEIDVQQSESKSTDEENSKED